MRRSDYILTLAAGFLTAPEPKLDDLYRHFAQRFELANLAKPGFVSLGGESAGQRRNFTDWITSLRNEQVLAVHFLEYPHNHEELPAHIAAAFSGVQELVMQVETAKGPETFFLATFRSPSYELNTAQLIALINQQKNPTSLWNRIHELLQESNSLNNRSAIARENIQEYLLSREGAEVLEYMLDKLTSEVQVECLVEEVEFNIQGFETLFYKSEFSFGDSGREYVYLYPVEEVSSTQLLELANAQPFYNELWDAVSKKTTEYGYTDLPVFKTEEWEEKLPSLTPEQLQSIAGIVCRVICEFCEEKSLKPIIPKELKEFFGPDELENKRIQARSRISDVQWYLQSIREPWEMYIFQAIPSLPTKGKTFSLEESSRQLSDALSEITAFAQTINSPFAEAFSLSHYFLTGPIPEGSFDEEHLTLILQALEEKGFSERARENFKNSFYFSEELLMLGWSVKALYGFFAHKLANVFGGMGSWNDSYMESEADQEKFYNVSETTFKFLNIHFATLLSQK